MSFAQKKIKEALGTATLFVYPPRKVEDKVKERRMYAELVTLDADAQSVIAKLMEQDFHVTKGSQGQFLDPWGKSVPGVWQYTTWIELPETLARFREQYGQDVKIVEVSTPPYEKTKESGIVKFEAPRAGFKHWVTDAREEQVLDTAVNQAIIHEMLAQLIQQRQGARSATQ